MGQDQSVRGEDGEFNDFIEKRRPFLNPDNERASHWSFEIDCNSIINYSDES